MNRPHSTTPTGPTGDGAGSTEPALAQQRLQREAAKIFELWKTRNWQNSSALPIDSSCLNRHKSLILNLAVEDYKKERLKSKGSLLLVEHCQQYSGLGTPLEHSIFRQLEVQQFLDENPEWLGDQFLFEWPEPNDTFLNFQVLEELGRGALARVYLCEQLQLGGRNAVVKIELGESVNEPSLLGKIRHPNIMPLHWADYNQSVGASYLCMPFLGRSTLVDLIKLAFRNGIPTNAAVIREASGLWIKESDALILESTANRSRDFFNSGYINSIVRLAVDLADALAYVHSQQVIHGDIKPSNVLLSPEGQPFLLDFNLGRTRGSSDGPAGGTLAYMAPEQLRFITEGSPDAQLVSSIATDIYSFGVLLYELLSGKTPNSYPSGQETTKSIARKLLAQQQDDCTSIRVLNPGVDQKLTQLIDSCLAFEPDKRPATMLEVREQLVQYSGIAASGRRYAKDNPIRTWLFGLGIGGTISAASIAYWLQPPIAERLYSQAVSAHEAGDFQVSIALLDQTLTKDAQFHAARLHRARCNLALGKYTSAIGDLRQLIQETKDPVAMAGYGYILNLEEKPDAAVLWYQAAIKHGLKNAASLNNLSVSLLLQTKPESPIKRIALAKPVLEEALRLNPDSVVIRMNALLLDQTRLENDAEANMEAAIEHVKWLSRKKHDHVQVSGRLYHLYHALAERKLIDPSKVKVKIALEKSRNPSAGTPIPRFLNPLYSGEND